MAKRKSKRKQKPIPEKYINDKRNPYPKQGEYPSVLTRKKHGKCAGD